jgi:methionyl-tRNA formyltransferase
MDRLRIGFFGLPLAAVLLLRDGHDLRFATLSPVQAPGRRRLLARLPHSRVIDLLVDDSGFERHLDSLFDAHPIDLIVSWFYTRRIAERWLSRPQLGAIGVHPSLLPRHRGPNPYFWAIDSGDSETGVTVHHLEPEYDTGAIIAQRRLPVGDRDAWQLARALDRPSLAALREVVGDFAARRFREATTQRNEDVTLAPEPSGEQLRVDWRWPTERVLRRLRALSPIPGLALELRGLCFFVTQAAVAASFPDALLPGEAFIGERLVLRTGDGALRVERAQLAERGAEPSNAPQAQPTLVSGEELAILLQNSG